MGSGRKKTWRKSRLAMYGGIMSLSIVLLGMIGPWISPYGAAEFSPNQLGAPSWSHILGSDNHGRDLLSRILRGTQVTLALALATVGLSGSAGIAWGLVAAYTPGVGGGLLNRAIDFVMSFPAIMTALFVVAIFGSSGKFPLIVSIAIALAPRFARVIRGSALPILQEDFILYEKALGASHSRILMQHMLPNLVAPITVLVSIYLPYVIILESGLSFLGLGAPPDVPTWGRIIAEGKAYMQVAPWLTIFPGLVIIFTALAFNLLGDGLRDVFDTRASTRLMDR